MVGVREGPRSDGPAETTCEYFQWKTKWILSEPTPHSLGEFHSEIHWGEFQVNFKVNFEWISGSRFSLTKRSTFRPPNIHLKFTLKFTSKFTFKFTSKFTPVNFEIHQRIIHSRDSYTNSKNSLCRLFWGGTSGRSPSRTLGVKCWKPFCRPSNGI